MMDVKKTALEAEYHALKVFLLSKEVFIQF